MACFRSNFLLWLIDKTHIHIYLHIEMFVWKQWKDTKAMITCRTKLLVSKKVHRGESNMSICFYTDLLIWKWQLINWEADQTFQVCFGVAGQAVESRDHQRGRTIENTAGFQMRPWKTHLTLKDNVQQKLMFTNTRI